MMARQRCWRIVFFTAMLFAATTALTKTALLFADDPHRTEREKWENRVTFFGEEDTGRYSLRILDRSVTEPATFRYFGLWKYEVKGKGWVKIDNRQQTTKIVLPKDKPSDAPEDNQLLAEIPVTQETLRLYFARWEVNGVAGSTLTRIGPGPVGRQPPLGETPEGMIVADVPLDRSHGSRMFVPDPRTAARGDAGQAPVSGTAAASSPPRVATAQETTADAGAAMSDDDARQTRDEWVKELEVKISQSRQDITQMPPRSPARPPLADSIRAWTKRKDALEKMDVPAIRAEIAADHSRKIEEAKAAEEARRAEAERQKAEAARLAAAREAKFNGWKGPWKTCPVCRGTGRDEVAEREANMRNASIIGSMTAGTNGVTKFPLAHVPCDFCGGTGEVPDRSR